MLISHCARQMIELPVIDLQEYKKTGDQALCDQVAECLRKYGVLCLRDEVIIRCRRLANTDTVCMMLSSVHRNSIMIRF